MVIRRRNNGFRELLSNKEVKCRVICQVRAISDGNCETEVSFHSERLPLCGKYSSWQRKGKDIFQRDGKCFTSL